MKRILIILSSIIFILLFSLYMGVSWFFSDLILRSRKGNVAKRVQAVRAVDSPSSERVTAWLSVPDTFVVEAADGKKIRGWHFQADSAVCAVVMAHGYSSSRTSMIRYFPLFEDCGCDIIAYDHRGHGLSDEAYCTFGIKESEDLLSVTEWLKEKTGFSGNQIAWLGVSWGGATVLQAGSNDQDVAFIISDSPFENWYAAVMERAERDYGTWTQGFTPMIKFLLDYRSGVDFDQANALKLAPDIKEPVFLIHSQTDGATASKQSVNIFQALNAASSVFHHTKWGNGHAKDITNNPEEYRALVDEFMRQYVPDFGKCNYAQTSRIDYDSTF